MALGTFVAVANMKGGVGKTTTVVSLAEALAADDPDARILVIDLDPQASASVALAGDQVLAELIQADLTLECYLDRRLLKKEKADVTTFLRRQVSTTWHQGKKLDLTLLPCGPYLRIVERELIYDLAKEDRGMSSIDGHLTRLFRDEILPLAKDFRYIIFDCAPGISPVTEIAIRLSDLVIVPTIPDYLSVFGLTAFHESLWNYRGHGLPPPKNTPSILITRMDRRISQHREVFDIIRHETQQSASRYRLFKTHIKTSASLVEGIMMPGEPTFHQKYARDVIGDILQPLVKEMKEMV